MKMASLTRTGARPGARRGGTPVRRVRHGVRDGIAVMAVSALSSVGLALVLALLTRLIVAAGK